MEAKSHSKEMQKNLDVVESRLNALEVSSADNYNKSLVSVLKILVENQKQVVNEFDHLKKAIDLLTLQVFKVQKDQRN